MATIQFCDHPDVLRKPYKYKTGKMDMTRVLESWRLSPMSFEWLHADGSIRTPDAMPVRARALRLEIEERLQEGGVFERPVLGIGLMDHVEFGAGRALFMALFVLGDREIEAHYPVSCADEFKPYLL